MALRSKFEAADLAAIEAALPDDPIEAAHVATAVCAARCIDAGLDDDAALLSLDQCLKVLRNCGDREGVH